MAFDKISQLSVCLLYWPQEQTTFKSLKTINNTFHANKPGPVLSLVQQDLTIRFTVTFDKLTP